LVRFLAWASRRAAWLAICFGYLTVFPYFERINNPNENARVWMTRAIVEHHELNIGKVSAEWGYVNDKATSGGWIYSGKAPGTSFIGVPVLYVESKLARLFAGGPPGKRATTLALRLFAVAVPMCLFWLFVARRLERELEEPALRALLLGGLAFGTMLYPYGILYVGHALGAALAFSGFLLSSSAPPGQARRSALAAAGALTGFAVVFEYQVAFAAVVIAAYTGVRHRRAALPFLVGALTAVIALGAYHHALFGRAWDTPFSHLENPAFARLHNDVRLAGLGLPRPRPLLTMLFSPDMGLFVFSPFLLIGLLGAVVAVVRGSGEARLEGVTILLVFLSMALFASGVPNWHAGWCVGPRYIAVVVPFLGWGIVLLHRLGCLARWVRPLLGGTVVVSVVLCGVSAAVYPHYPEQFDNPVFDLAFPLLGDGHVPYSVGHLLGLHGLVSLTPLAAAVLVPLAIGLAGDDPRPSVWLSATGGAIGVALLLLISLGAYGRKPRPEEAHAATFVRATWEPPPASAGQPKLR